jgi:methane/ammonia monooxygenase subunit C
VQAIGQPEIVIIIAAYFVVGTSIFTSLLRSKRAVRESQLATYKIKQHMVMLLWMLLLTFFVYVGGGFLAHQDASWHQLSLPSDEIMPARLITYLALYPAYMIVGGAAWLQAKVRFEAGLFNRELKVALILATFIPFLFLPAQDPDAMGFSVDLPNTFSRAGYGLMMLVWLAAVGYIITQQGLAVLKLLRESEL